MIASLYHLLFPPRCMLCRAPLPDGADAMVCSSCAVSVRRDYRQTDGVRAAETDDAAAALQYKGRVRSAMLRYKFGYAKGYARWFAAHTAPVLAAKMDAWQPDVITYVPLGLRRRFRRGYNQSELIARLVAAQLGLPCEALLRKRHFVAQQSAQGRTVRRTNAKSAFCAAQGAAAAGRRIVVLDDVLTTGATMAACAKLLRQAGAARVYALCVTKTP